MSSAPMPPAPPHAPAPLPSRAPTKELIIVGHTMLFYWWPLWFFGYLFAILTWASGYRAAILPEHSEYDGKSAITVRSGGQPTSLSTSAHGIEENGRFRERMALSSTLGILYVFIFILVIVITTVPLRGVSSLVAIVVIALIIVTISYLGWWDNILSFFGSLRIHMNMGFYIFFSTVLFVIWAAVFFIYDRMNYWRVTPGQITHRFVFGGGERSFDTEGLAFTKLRDDLFRHLILGLGSGDLVMDPLKAGGASKEEMSIHNVLFIGSKLKQIDEMIAKQPTAPG